MTIRFVGTKQLRQNMAKITKDALKKKERIIVLRKNQPIFELLPLSDKDALLKSFMKDIADAQADKKARRVKTQAQVKKMLGL